MIYLSCLRKTELCFHLPLYFLCFYISCAFWICKILSDWTCRHQTFIFFHDVLKFTFYYWVCRYHLTFFQESATSSRLIRLTWDEGRVDKDKEQLWINTCTLTWAMQKWATLFSNFFPTTKKTHQFPPTEPNSTSSPISHNFWHFMNQYWRKKKKKKVGKSHLADNSGKNDVRLKTSSV